MGSQRKRKHLMIMLNRFIQTILCCLFTAAGVISAFIFYDPSSSMWDLTTWLWGVVAWVLVLRPTIEYWRERISINITVNEETTDEEENVDNRH